MIPFEGTLADRHVVNMEGRGSYGMLASNQGDYLSNGDGTAFLQADLRLMLADVTLSSQGEHASFFSGGGDLPGAGALPLQQPSGRG